VRQDGRLPRIRHDWLSTAAGGQRDRGRAWAAWHRRRGPGGWRFATTARRPTTSTSPPCQPFGLAVFGAGGVFGGAVQARRPSAALLGWPINRWPRRSRAWRSPSKPSPTCNRG